MYLDRALVALAILTLSACSSSDELEPARPDAGGGSPMDAGPLPDAGPGDSGTAFAQSAKGRVRFKGAERMRNDIAQTLGLTSAEVCAELGLYDCVDYVHTVALGGVEPYTLGVTRPLENTSATTPLAVERVALAACGRRVDQDLAAPADALIFRDLGITDGRIPDLEAPGVEDSLQRLYRRALLRNPTDTELEQLGSLHAQISQDQAPDVGRDWAVLSCFAVVTSMEGLFY